MELTGAMKERIDRLEGEWRDEGGGYASLSAYSSGFMPGELAYVSLPKDHPDIGKDYDDLDPEVNGGLTYAEDNVFGWDYMHAYNSGSPETDILSALEYFRARATAPVEE